MVANKRSERAGFQIHHGITAGRAQRPAVSAWYLQRRAAQYSFGERNQLLGLHVDSVPKG
jgi:hypothetical protein